MIPRIRGVPLILGLVEAGAVKHVMKAAVELLVAVAGGTIVQVVVKIALALVVFAGGYWLGYEPPGYEQPFVVGDLQFKAGGNPAVFWISFAALLAAAFIVGWCAREGLIESLRCQVAMKEKCLVEANDKNAALKGRLYRAEIEVATLQKEIERRPIRRREP